MISLGKVAQSVGTALLLLASVKSPTVKTANSSAFLTFGKFT